MGYSSSAEDLVRTKVDHMLCQLREIQIPSLPTIDRSRGGALEESSTSASNIQQGHAGTGGSWLVAALTVDASMHDEVDSWRSTAPPMSAMPAAEGPRGLISTLSDFSMLLTVMEAKANRGSPGSKSALGAPIAKIKGGGTICFTYSAQLDLLSLHLHPLLCIRHKRSFPPRALGATRCYY